MTTATAEPPKTDQQTKALTTTPKHQTPAVYSRIADPMDFVGKMGNTLYESKMFGLSNPAQGRVLAFAFLVRGVDPFEFRARHHVIGGNVTMSSEAMLADFRADLGGTHRVVTRTPDKAAIELTLGKQKQIFEFTWAEAQEEDYAYTSPANDGKVAKKLADGKVNPAALKDNWKTPRRRMQMLWARVVSDGVGVMAPEICGGKLTPEELGVLASDATVESSPAAATAPQVQHGSQLAAGEIIEGDFEVREEGNPAAEAEAEANVETAAAKPEPEIRVSSSTSAAPAKSEAVEHRSKPETPPFEPDVPAADADKPAAVMANPPPASERKMALLRELKALKTELMTDEQYKAVLDKKGVTTATQLDLEALEKMVGALRQRKAAQAGKDEISQWAEGAVKGGPAGN